MEKFRKRKLAEELLGTEGSVHEAIAVDRIPDAIPFIVLDTKLDKVIEYKPALS